MRVYILVNTSISIRFLAIDRDLKAPVMPFLFLFGALDLESVLFPVACDIEVLLYLIRIQLRQTGCCAFRRCGREHEYRYDHGHHQ